MKPIYLDYAATTPVDARVVQAMLPWLSEQFGNPASSSHSYGWDAEEAVERARAQVAQVIGADARDVIWTSGATESNNLAIKGAAHAHQHKGKHLITVVTEHKAVLDPMHSLEKEGFEVTYLPVDADGLISVEAVADALRPDTVLVSVMLVNNEIGVIQDIAAIGQLCVDHKLLFHVDGAQAVGKVAIDVEAMHIDLLSLSAHKAYGPKGMGALYVRRRPRVALEALIHGGGHERGLRSGTLATHQIVGMGEAFALAEAEREAETARIQGLAQQLRDGLATIPAMYWNGSLSQRVPHNVNISVDGIEGEALMMDLPGLALSSGSACSSASLAPSYVLKALGRSDQQAHSSLRISMGRYTSEDNIRYAVTAIRESIERLRALSPFWDQGKLQTQFAQIG